MSTRETILTNVATQFAAITVANGYASEVDEVFRDAQLDDDLTTPNPVFNIVDPGADEVKQYAAAGVIRSTMTLTIEAKVLGTAIESAQKTQIDNIVADVRKLIHSPISLGAAVCFTELVEVSDVFVTGITATVMFVMRIDYGYDGATP